MPDSETEMPRISSELVTIAEQQIVEQLKKIDFYITEYSIELLVNKMKDEEFVVPPYQRAFTWEPERKSRFIESVIMGLPIPFLFFWESPETGKLEVVDGSQRLRTLQEFILGDFEIGDLEELSLLSGFRFKDLPEARQRKIKNRSIRGIILGEQADEESRFDLFDRINTGSKVANKAEVRRGALPGPFLDLVISLATNHLFTDLAPVPEKQEKLREREELVLRFFAYGDGLDGYRDKVSPFLYAYAKKLNRQLQDEPELVTAYRSRFLETMEFVNRSFPYGFRRSASGRATPRARFEAIAIGSYLALREHSDLVVDPSTVETWLAGTEFGAVTGSDGANAIARLRARINFVRDQLIGV